MMTKKTVKKVIATPRKQRVQEPIMTEIVFKFRASEIKKLGGHKRFCDLVYSLIDATTQAREN
ncbi:MAG: hypothetical protein ABI851_12235 [Saprospiraceae bacterium]